MAHAAVICRYWRAGHCARRPCRFVHGEQAATRDNCQQRNVWRNPATTSPSSSSAMKPNLLATSSSFSPKPTTIRSSSSSSSSKPTSRPIVAAAVQTIPSSSSSSSKVIKNPTAAAAKNRFSSSSSSRPTNPPTVTATNCLSRSTDISSSTTNSVCKDFLAGRNCFLGNRCRYLHCSYISTDQSFSLLMTLTPQPAAAAGDMIKAGPPPSPLTITGIALPSGSRNLYSGCKDGSVRAWDIQTGQCVGTLNLGAGGAVGCMITEGPWLFVGIPNAVKAWNTATATTDDPITLTCGSSSSSPTDSSSGQVYALAEANETIYAGTHGGDILAWKYTAAVVAAAAVSPTIIQPVASLTGHKLGVVALALTTGSQTQRLYSGSMDHTIRVWNLTTSTCLQILTGHTSVVMSLICYDRFLLSCSLDQTIRTWAATQTGDLEERDTRIEEHGLLGLYGVHDHQVKPILLCSSNNDTVRLYDLPSFTERGTLFTKAEVRAMHVYPEGRLFFTGDAAGEIKVWRWSITDEDEEMPDAI